MKYIIAVLIVVALVAAALSYDPSEDPTFHNCTAKCAVEGCTFPGNDQ